MEVADLDSKVHVVVAQVLCHALGEGGNQHPVSHLNPLSDLSQQVVNLKPCRHHLHLGIHETRGTDQLFHHVGSALLKLVSPRSGRDEKHLVVEGLKLLKGEGAVVQGGGEPEPVLYQVLFS